MLEQFGMRAGAVKNHFVILLVDTIYEKPIRFDMTLPPIFIVSLQWVVFMFWQQCLPVKNHGHNFIEFANIFILFFHKFAVFLKRAVIFRSIHKTLVIRVQICKHFFERVERLQCVRDFTCKHIINFFNGGDSFGVRYQCSACGITVFGAERAVVNGGFRSGSKRDDSSPRRNFAGNFKSTAVSRDFYGLCHGHRLNITQRVA